MENTYIPEKDVIAQEWREQNMPMVDTVDHKGPRRHEATRETGSLSPNQFIETKHISKT